MKVLFVAWAGGGNSTPVLGLGTRLAARGHTVSVASLDDMGHRFAAVGIEHERFGWDAGEVLALIGRAAPDAVVVDFMMPSWMSQAGASGRPWVGHVHTWYAEQVDAVGVGVVTVDKGAPVDAYADAIERALNDESMRAVAAPFAAAYDPTASAAIDIIEAVG